MAKARLAEFMKEHRQKEATFEKNAYQGKMTAGDAIELYKRKLEEDVKVKSSTKHYWRQIITALVKSWPELVKTDIRKISKSDCRTWASEFSTKASSTRFNNTVAALKNIFENAIENGIRYDNPALSLKRIPVESKHLVLPDTGQFFELLKAMHSAANLSGYPRITHHDLRHLFATICIESGVDVPTVSRWLGHQDGGALAMKTYGHLRNEHSKAAAQKVQLTPKPQEEGSEGSVSSRYLNQMQNRF